MAEDEAGSPGESGSAGDSVPALEQWPEDEGRAPHVRPEPVSIPRLLLRAAPRVTLAVLLAVLYSGAQGTTRLAFLLSWIVVVGSMLMPRWRRYVETGQKHKPAPAEPLVEEKKPVEPDPEPDEDAIDPRDEWDLPEELPGEAKGERPDDAGAPTT